MERLGTMELSGKRPSSQERNAKNPLSCIEGNYCGVFSGTTEAGDPVEIRKAIAVVPCRCKSQWCKDCRVSHMVAWRERLRPVVASWAAVRMLTLTIDRSKWSGAEAAYHGIQKKRSVAEFVRKLNRPRCKLAASREFFYAIEFHPNSPEWVHWHLALKPAGRWPNKGAHDWIPFQNHLAKKWGHGFVQASDCTENMSGEHAMNYLTKYIAKQDVEAPKWVLDYAGNFRKFSTSRGLCGSIKSRPEPKGEEGYKRVTVAERIARCQGETKVLEIAKTRIGIGEDATIKKRYKFRKKIPISWSDLRESREGLEVLRHAMKLVDPIDVKGKNANNSNGSGVK